jgi:hypothetical protein
MTRLPYIPKSTGYHGNKNGFIGAVLHKTIQCSLWSLHWSLCFLLKRLRVPRLPSLPCNTVSSKACPREISRYSAASLSLNLRTPPIRFLHSKSCLTNGTMTAFVSPFHRRRNCCTVSRTQQHSAQRAPSKHCLRHFQLPYQLRGKSQRIVGPDFFSPYIIPTNYQV